MIQAFNIDLFAKTITAFIGGSQLLVHSGWQCVVTIQITVAADTQMFDSDQFRYVIEMVQNVFDCCGLVNLNKHSDSGNAHNAAVGRHLFDCFVGLAAWMAWSKSPAVRMG